MTAARISFAAGDTQVVVRVEDNPTSRDLLAKFPLTLEFEEFGGREKISYLAAPLATHGSPGSAPRDGTLVYYKPWGNLGFYNDATGGHDDNLITQALAIACDVTDEALVAAAVDETVATYGRLDAAFDNAGVQVPPHDAADEPAEVYDHVNAICPGTIDTPMVANGELDLAEALANQPIGHLGTADEVAAAVL